MAGSNVDAAQPDGSTALTLSSEKGYNKIVELLLAAGATTDPVTKDGSTPLYLACQNGHEYIVETLLAAGANPKPPSCTLEPMLIARVKRHFSIEKLLSHPLRYAVMTTFQRVMTDLRAQLQQEKEQWERLLLERQLALREGQAQAEQRVADVKRLLLQRQKDFTEFSRREAQYREENVAFKVQQERVNQLLASTKMSDYIVEGSHLNVEACSFAHGGNGTIHRGLYHGTAVAVKYLSEAMPEMYKKEVRMWCKLRHPNVLQLLGLSLTPARLMIVMELMEKSLFDVLHDSTVGLEWGRRVELAHGIAAGLSYIHSREAVHRDIKSLNVLVRGREVKIADFGSTRGLESMQETTNQAGTMAWLAPELFSNASPSSKVDVYAFGVVMFELATREIPWRGYSPASIMGSVLAGERPQVKMEILGEVAGPEFVKLMQQSWKPNAEDRPTSAEVLKELTVILGVTPPPSSSSSSPSTPPSPGPPLKTPPQANYGNFSDGSFPDFVTPSTHQPPAPGPSAPQPACSSTDWSMEAWLISLGLSKYIPTFQEHELFTPNLIKGLDLTELKEEIGIAAYGARKQIFEAAKLI